MAHIQIPDVSPRIQYTADGVEDEFTYPFPIFVDDDLDVYLGSTLQTSGYTVAGAGVTAGGTVTFDTPPADETVVTLVRNLAIERTSDFQTSGSFRANDINTDLDKVVAMLQQLEESTDRALLLPVTSIIGTSTVLPTATSRRALVWNTAADALENTVYDPDTALALATAASADAAAAATSASNAAAAAEAAEAAAAAAGSSALTAGSVTLVDGVDEYLLPAPAPGPANVEVNIEGATLSTDGTDYTITDTLGLSQTIKLTAGVAATPSADEWEAGLKMDLTVRVGGVGSGDLLNGSITTPKLADGAVTAAKLATDAVETAKIKDANVTAAKMAANSIATASLQDDGVTLAKLAHGTANMLIGFDGSGVPSEVAAPSVSKGTTSNQLWTNGSTITVAHGAGASPDDVFIDIECQSDEAGYVAGKVLRIAPFADIRHSSPFQYRGCVLSWDATNVYFLVGIHGLAMLNTSGSYVALTPSNWRVRFPWRIY